MEDYKIGFSFSTITGEYIGPETVYLEVATGEYPHADNVTFVPPPKTERNQVQIWTGKDWNIVPDYRGLQYYSNKGKLLGIVEELDGNEYIVETPPECKPHELVDWDYNNKYWIKSIETGYKYDDSGKVIAMTQEEKIQAGLEPLPEGMIIENGHLRALTKDELFDLGKLTVEQYNKIIDSERQSRYMSETDKMGLMYLRGECTLEEWKLAMDKIREELPKK